MLMINCSSNILSENFVMDSEYGIVVGVSSSNKFYSNYFINVTQLIMDTEIGAGLPSENSWDNGVEGNYWCDYVGADADGDGIGDSAQVLYGNNQDNYPLMDYPSISTDPETDSQEPHSSSTGFTLPAEATYGIFVALIVLVAAVAVMKLRKR